MSGESMSIREYVNDAVSRLGIVGELMRFLWARKMWWLIPMIIALFVFSVILVLGASGILGPFIGSPIKVVM